MEDDKLILIRNIISNINNIKNTLDIDTNLIESVLIKDVCSLFDLLKDQEVITEADLKFLRYVSNFIGIPHYYDMLSKKFEKNTNISNLDISSFSSYIAESTLYTRKDFKLHKYQKDVLDNFQEKVINRYLLTAPTSFGKTQVVYEIIQKMKYKNVLLIFPTIALLSENYEKIYSNPLLRSNYKIHTISNINNEQFGEKNIFVFTPERYSSFHDKNINFNMDFVFIDEFYKIDNQFLDENKGENENERDQVYRLASSFAIRETNDVLLVGPYLEINFNNSFGKFLENNHIKVLDFNMIEIVNKKYLQENINGNKKLIKIVSNILAKEQNLIIYKQSKDTVKKTVKYLTDKFTFSILYSEDYNQFLDHIKNEFGENWFLYQSLKRGIAAHHGLIPKYIQKDIIRFFNKGYIKILVCTTTITEGVNTSAKTMLVLSSKKGKKDLKKFDAKNISGRSGRFLEHYTGSVFIGNKEFDKILNSDKTEDLKHKNYDIGSIKTDVDIDNTDEKYLNEDDKSKKEKTNEEIAKLNIDNYIFTQFKSISRENKIILYKAYKSLSHEDMEKIKSSITNFQRNSVDKYTLDFIFKILKENNIILPEDLKKIDFFLNKKARDGHTLLSTFISLYLGKSFKEQISYLITNNNQDIDKAINNAANFTFNILKYIIPKYIGLFNLIFKYIESKNQEKPIEEIIGFDRFVSRLEYGGAISEKGQMAFDYGCSFNVLNKIENNNSKISLDDYEKKQFEEINNLFNSSD